LTVARFEIEKIVLKYAIENADEADIKSLQENIRDAQKKIEANINVIDENIQFHNLLAKASKNHLFVIVVEAVTTAVRHFMSELGPDSDLLENEKWYSENVLNSKNTLSYHKDILNAVIEKKVDQAVDILENHLLEVKKRLRPLAGQQRSQPSNIISHR
jgi:DNA-binding FadR family transcriptional regulator